MKAKWRSQKENGEELYPRMKHAFAGRNFRNSLDCGMSPPWTKTRGKSESSVFSQPGSPLAFGAMGMQAQG